MIFVSDYDFFAKVQLSFDRIYRIVQQQIQQTMTNV